MIKAFIFDIDGTLIDSVDIHTLVWQQAFDEYGKKIPFDQIRNQIGKGADKLLPVFLSEKEINDFGNDLIDFRANLFKTQYLSQIKPFPMVRELFERINTDGKKIALASSSKKDEITEYKKIANIEDLVEIETSADDAQESKPAPDIFEVALKLLGKPQLDQVIVIGDSPFDAEAAQKAHLKAIGVLCGGFSKNDLLTAGCRG